MRHQPDDVPSLVGDPCDVVDGAVRVVAVAGDDTVIGTKLGERLGLADVIPLEVIDGKPEH
jgi:glutamate formiminotransferase